MLEGLNMKGVSRIQIIDVNFPYDQLFFLKKDKERKERREGKK